MWTHTFPLSSSVEHKKQQDAFNMNQTNVNPCKKQCSVAAVSGAAAGFNMNQISVNPYLGCLGVRTKNPKCRSCGLPASWQSPPTKMLGSPRFGRIRNSKRWNCGLLGSWESVLCPKCIGCLVASVWEELRAPNPSSPAPAPTSRHTQHPDPDPHPHPLVEVGRKHIRLIQELAQKALKNDSLMPKHEMIEELFAYADEQTE